MSTTFANEHDGITDARTREPFLFDLSGGRVCNFERKIGVLKTDEQEALFSLLLGIDSLYCIACVTDRTEATS
jgi:hypothetical protein